MTFGTIDDSGTLYVNGQKAGSADDWSHPWTFDITQYLHVGDNSIALLVQNDWGPGGPYKGCDIEPIGRALEGLQVSPARTVAAGAIGGDTQRRLLVHYTMEFQLPGPPLTLSESLEASPGRRRQRLRDAERPSAGTLLGGGATAGHLVAGMLA